MNKSEFIKSISRMTSAISNTGKLYRSIFVRNNSIHFFREHKYKHESISIDELYELYISEESINTGIAKSYISGRVQSPAVAILHQLHKNNESKNQLIEEVITNANQQEEIKLKDSAIIKDETRFFKAFSELVGEKYVQSKSIGKPVNSSQVFLSNNYQEYYFDHKINEVFFKILDNLNSDRNFNSSSLSHHVDGVVLDHPLLKNRIVEFDEEQHFTPARLETLKHLKTFLPDKYFAEFIRICNDLDYLNDEVLQKHRIKNRLKSTPKSFLYFINWLEITAEKESGYISRKKGFDFIGGRIAQRAYYDTLRDTAHISEMNSSFESPLRFAKKTFEDMEGMGFSTISDQRLQILIGKLLSENYKFDFKIE